MWDNEKQKVCMKAWREANPEKIKAYQEVYRKANPEKQKIYTRKRRALKNRVGHEPYMDNYIFERDGWMCQLCGRKINKRLKWPNPLSKSIDHVVPLSKGGSDAQASHLRCNIGKHAINKGQLRLFG